MYPAKKRSVYKSRVTKHVVVNGALHKCRSFRLVVLADLPHNAIAHAGLSWVVGDVSRGLRGVFWSNMFGRVLVFVGIFLLRVSIVGPTSQHRKL